VRDAIVVAFVGVTLGFLGYVWANGQHGQFAATSLIRMEPNNVEPNAPPPTPDQANRFVQSEVLLFNTSAFERSIQQQLHFNDALSLNIQQVGITDIVTVQATAARRSDAQRASDAAAETMVRQVTKSATDPLLAERAALQVRLATLSGAPKPSRAVARSARRQAINSTYQQLAQLETSIALAKIPARQTAIVALTSERAGVQKAVSPIRRGLMLGLVGLVAALGLVIWRDKRSTAAISERS
jgi:hypothetical protein